MVTGLGSGDQYHNIHWEERWVSKLYYAPRLISKSKRTLYLASSYSTVRPFEYLDLHTG